uniref:S-protein homolog n=1 Tax=Kalanchoe fedtschenkoi TaxID=63787 RepID=A0A7N0VG19_KALFE
MSFSKAALALVLALAIHQAIGPDQALVADACIDFFPKFTTIVENQMGYPIRVHCKSKDNDMGEHILDNFGDVTQFSFRSNIFGKTRFWCDVLWEGLWKVYDAFVDRRDYYRCLHNDCKCHWGITPQGPCLYNVDTNKFDMCEPWR